MQNHKEMGENLVTGCSADECVDPLVSGLYASSFLASSRYNFLYSANFAKLYGSSGWSPAPRDKQPWLQVDLGRKYRLRAIRHSGDLQLTLPGNWNYYQVKRNVFHYAFTAKHIRLLPLAWNTENGGKIGVRLELFGCSYDSYVLQYNGDDSVVYMYPGKRSRTLEDDISINFKTLEQDGLLLHSEGIQGDLFTLELKRGRLYLHISLGSSVIHKVDGRITLTAGSLLDNLHWHYVTIKRYGRQVNFTVDSQTVTGICKGDFTHLDLDTQLYVGGVIEQNLPHLPTTPNFRGCLENVFINDVNIIYKAQNEDSDIRIPRKKKLHFACRDILLKPMTFAGPNNYLQVPGYFRRPRMFVKFKFRSWDYTGLLMFTRFADDLGALELGLSEGQINVTIFQPGKKKLQFAAGYRLNDGYWHTVDLAARDNLLTLTIDEEEGSPLKITNPFTIRTGDRYFFGGCPKTNNTVLRCETKLNRFHGCMQHIFIDNEQLDIDIVLQRQWGRYAELLLGTCGITDRCTPNPCEHEGRCIQSWDDFICLCENTGYKGEVCHMSVYKESCEAYRLSGKYWSGNYTIDPDLSGPLKPFEVYCKMKSYKAWTVILNDRVDGTKVTGSSIDQPYIGDVNYWNASWDEVTALANTSLYCEQWIDYSCYKSRLLNTPNGRPFGYWIGRNNVSHYYWGGTFREVQKCGCAINQTCIDPKFQCNCDADYRQWYSDKGYLDWRDHLPVRKVVVGDTNRTGSEAHFTVGPLRCHGDRNIWNTIAFTKPTYITFPTFRPGSSADISFHFKTYRDHGVFLENSDDQLRNFIRIELNTTHNLVFIFMVGDGIINVTLKSPVPLNDNEWHFVQAEINVKLARIKVDYQPWAVTRFPGQTFVTMEFTHPILVGAANRTLRPFLGCLRGLRMNGVPLDLEGKVNEEQGIRRNCTGQCLNTTIPCRNSGQCIEGYASYTCDCNNTAFDGFYCHKGSVDLRYKLGLITHKYQLTHRNLADGYPHYINITRHNRTIKTQVDYMEPIVEKIPWWRMPEVGDIDYDIQRHNAPGFIGCISGVRYNVYAPLKALFRPNETDPPVTTQGYVSESNCGAFPPVLGYVPWEVDPWFTSIEYIYIHDDLGLFWITEKSSSLSVKVATNSCSTANVTFGLQSPAYATESPGLEPPPSSTVEGLAVAAVIVILALLLLFGGLYSIYVYAYQQKGSYRTNEPKNLESPSSARPLTETLRREKKNLPEIEEEFRSD
ncbi:Contactin-associated protein 1 [Collichthys lucidus]|uniref:Contactin-associated protein 1 n=1 Tax=Collichthys lucidus TaxID=240159 RepID=A0A4U5VUC1_COLLU|nr:Contactin-associated protein 1 [Collichthys lucidus]